jgi:hypothetical protein
MQEGNRADLALGELPVVVVASSGGPAPGNGPAPQVGDAGDTATTFSGRRRVLYSRGRSCAVLVRRAQLGEQGYLAAAAIRRRPAAGDRRASPHLAQHQHPRAGASATTRRAVGRSRVDLDPVDGRPSLAHASDTADGVDDAATGPASNSGQRR